MNFKDIKNINIPEGVVVKITSKGVVLWERGVQPDIPDLPTPLANEIYYISTDGNIISTKSSSYDGQLPISNTYENGIGKMVFEKDLTELRKYMFSSCNTLQYISIPLSITTIGESVFGYCTALKTIVIPDSVTSLGDYVFDNCTSLESITMSEYLTTIGRSVFQKCSSLKSVTLPKTLTSIDNTAFYLCTALESITIPEGVTRINYNTFYGCSSLKSVILSNSITRINSSAFSNCTSLSSITCEAMTAPIIDSDTTFKNVADVGILYVPQGSSGYDVWLKALPLGWRIQYVGEQKNNQIYYTSTDGNIVTPYKLPTDNTLVSNTYENGQGIITFENDLNSLDTDMFRHCSTLQNIIISNSVTSIGTSTFNDCSSLQSIVIPDSVIEMGGSVFFECTSLKNVTLSDNVKVIKYATFMNCSSLESITIPEGVTELENEVFAYCSKLYIIYAYPLSAPKIYEYTFYGTGTKRPSGKSRTVYVKSGATGYCDGDWYKYPLSEYGWGVEYTL